MARGRLALAYARRTRCPVLALEAQSRLGHEHGDPRLERVPDRLCPGRGVADPPGLPRGLSPWLGAEPDVPQRPALLRYPAAARTGLRRPAVLRALFLPRARSARTPGQIGSASWRASGCK